MNVRGVGTHVNFLTFEIILSTGSKAYAIPGSNFCNLKSINILGSLRLGEGFYESNYLCADSKQ